MLSVRFFCVTLVKQNRSNIKSGDNLTLVTHHNGTNKVRRTSERNEEKGKLSKHKYI